MALVRVALLLFLATAHAAWGQVNTGLSASILVVDRDALFTGTIFGQRILSDVDRATELLVAENSQIEAQLIAEERDLTERRASLGAEEFRTLADTFDERVQELRATQEAKSNAIGTELDEARLAYFQAIVPILGDLLIENRAVAMLDKRSVLISANIIDVTDRAIERIDAQLGDGLDLVGPVGVPSE